jgi:DNA-binding NarL/FixJ family response regulator
MPLVVVLAVGVDSLFSANERSLRQSAGCHFAYAGSIREAITQLRDGDFDLILLGDSIPIEGRERLTFLIRASGSRIPVVSVTDSAGGHDSFTDATIRNEPDDLLRVIGELLAKRARAHAAAGACVEEARPLLHPLKDLRTLQMLWARNTSRLGGGI